MGWAFNQRPSLLTMYVIILPDTLDHRPNSFSLNINIQCTSKESTSIAYYTIYTNKYQRKKAVCMETSGPSKYGLMLNL